MSDYPDPDEEYELMYADEYELLRETEENEEPNVIKKANQAKRSLDFSSPAPKKLATTEPAPTTLPTITEEEISLTPSLQPIDEILTPANSNKRTADDLFGDIGDIDFDEVGLPSKRQKTEEETDLELIDKILEGRRLRQILAEPTARGQAQKSCYEVRENVSLDIPRWAFIPLTNSDGERMYVKFDSEEEWESSLNLDSVEHAFNNQALYEEAKGILEKKVEERTRLATQLSQPLPSMEEDFGTKLWVDKYRPDSYVDLLTEEPVNRALLHWLHLWDKIVFKKEVKVKEPQQRNAFQKRTGQFQMVSKWKGKKESEPEVDEDGRPHHKVALLCGPPGVGKTTLAHLLATLTGYRPVELNASDERSVDAFRNALQSATLMQSVLDAERRPNCLILDEIDGAPLPTVELLVKWCTATKTESNKKKAAKIQPLKRPVIAICNDLYATALRPLRPIAQVIHVAGISSVRLTARLAWAAKAERLTANPRALAALAKRANGDVRAALHALSFVKARAKQQLTIEDVMNANIGEKDTNKSLMQALQAVFTIKDVPEPVAECTKVISAHGDYDRVIDGIFENYLQARVDSRLNLACATLTWLRTYDEINSWTQRRQNYALYGMLPLCAAACYVSLAARAAPHLHYPVQGQEMYRRKQEQESIVSSVATGAAPSMKSGRRALRLDILSLLPHLLAPQLRAANVQLCSENELKSLRAAAGAMCDYGLQYVQQRTPDGLYAFVLEPDIYKVAFFGNEERVRPPPHIRQAIAREQQLEQIRRTEAMTTRLSQRPPEATKAKASLNAPVSLPNHLQRLQPKEVAPKAPQVHKDFFGRIVPIIECSQIRLPDGSRDVISSSSVFYQYREGFNNAVRRSVRMRDLL